jgi:lysophospholipase L1-like esterase
MHHRILLACLVLAAGVSACSGTSTPQNSATGGTTATSSGGSNGVAGGGTAGSVGSTGGANGGTTSQGGSSGGGGLPASGGSKVVASSGGNSPGGTSIASTGGTSTVSTGGTSITGTGGTGVTGTGGTSIASTGGTSIASTGGTGTGGGGVNASGGRIGTGGTSSVSAGGTSSSGGRVGTGGISASGGSTGGKPDAGPLTNITVHLAGDSTMANYAATTTQEGWGQEFGQFFVSTVTIDNQAQGGANVQSFYSGKWKTLIANVQAGDYVLAAFGINDSGTTHGPVSVADFTAELSTMADEVAAKKATFIPTTSSPLQVWVGGKETNDRLQPYCDATIAVGKTKGLLVDDLNAAGVAYYNSIGQTAAAALTFNGDKAHFDKAGATAMAQLAAQELTRIGSPLAAYLK